MIWPFDIALRQIFYRPLASSLTIATFALGLAIILLMNQIHSQVNDRITRDTAPVDLIVGAKGSPVQLVLSSVLHSDIPVGNIPLKSAEQLRKTPLVKNIIPLALGDNARGFRIVGTTPDYITLYNGRVAQGRLFEKSGEAVLGAAAAQKLGLRLNESFVGNHGLNAGGEAHDHFPYTVVGILAPTGTIIDRLILTPVQSVWDVHTLPHEHVHGHAHGHDHDHEHDHEVPEREITAAIVMVKSPVALATLPRSINATSDLQAARPAFEIARLMRLVSVGRSAMDYIGMALIVLAALMIFGSLASNFRARVPELALLRALGAPRHAVMLTLVAEGAMLGLLATLLGWLTAHGVLALLAASPLPGIAPIGLEAFHRVSRDAPYLLAAGAATLLACLVPAWQSYRLDIRHNMRQG